MKPIRTQQPMTSRILGFLHEHCWATGTVRVTFLAAGEYNANYRVESAEGTRVLRINHGSQLGLGHRQIAYEYEVLRALAHTGVTPRPFACHPDPEPLGGGALLMAYLPGGPLDYHRDLETAARIFAKVHTAPVPDTLIVQADPVSEIAAESHDLILRYPDHPRTRERDQLLAFHETIRDLARQTRSLFAEEPLCLVNTEVNAGNFLISPDGAFLVDWEKAVISCRYQDLGHFLAPTTTLWKTDTILSDADRDRFLSEYHRLACPDTDQDALNDKTRILEKTIRLRALSWCYMAFYEYTRDLRPLQHPGTLARIIRYLDDMPRFTG